MWSLSLSLSIQTYFLLFLQMLSFLCLAVSQFICPFFFILNLFFSFLPPFHRVPHDFFHHFTPRLSLPLPHPLPLPQYTFYAFLPVVHISCHIQTLLSLFMSHLGICKVTDLLKEGDWEPGCVKYSVIHTLHGPVKTPFAPHCVALEKCIGLQGDMNGSSDVKVLSVYHITSWVIISAPIWRNSFHYNYFPPKK